MTTFLLTIGAIMLALGLVSSVSSTCHRRGESSARSLLRGDIKSERPSGKFVFYFPIMTSIIISVILTLVLYFLR